MDRAIVLCLLVLTGCGESLDEADGPFASEAAYRQQRAAALAELDRSIGTPAASDMLRCRAVAVGEQACGGPVEYAVYSVEATDTTRVEAAAERTRRLDLRANEQFGYASTCMLLLPPTLAVQGGVCVADLAP